MGEKFYVVTVAGFCHDSAGVLVKTFIHDSGMGTKGHILAINGRTSFYLLFSFFVSCDGMPL